VAVLQAWWKREEESGFPVFSPISGFAPKLLPCGGEQRQRDICILKR